VGTLDDLLQQSGLGPETLLPSQLQNPRQATAEVRLMSAVLEDAIRLYTRSGGKKKRTAYEEAEVWFWSDDVGTFSFLGVCEAFGIDPKLFRKRLAEGKVVVPVRRQIGQAHPVAHKPRVVRAR
jgi:hypothetical protein